MTISLFELTNLIFAIILIGASIYILASQYVKNATNRIFAIAIGFFACIILLDNFKTHDKVTMLVMVESLFFTMPVLIYLYTCSFIKNSTTLDRTSLYHFIPAVMALQIHGCIYYFYNNAEYELLYSFPWINTLVDTMGMVLFCQFAVYIGLSIDKLRQFKFWLEAHYSTTEELGLTWLNHFIAGIFILFISGFLLFGFVDLSAIITFYDILTVEFSIELWFFTLVNGFVVWATLYCLFTPEVFSCHFAIENNKDDENLDANKQYKNDTFLNQNHVADEQRLSVTHLSKLHTIMQNEKPYLDPNMGLKDLAEKVQLPQRALSSLLNNELNQSFYNYVNYYRVEEVKFRLSQRENSSAKLEGIAIDSGFRSSSTFNRLFKLHTKMTPQAYREQQLIAEVLV